MYDRKTDPSLSVCGCVKDFKLTGRVWDFDMRGAHRGTPYGEDGFVQTRVSSNATPGHAPTMPPAYFLQADCPVIKTALRESDACSQLVKYGRVNS